MSATLPVAVIDFRKVELDRWKVAIGAALRRAVTRRGWSLKEFAGEVNRDTRQCARWMAGSERPQLDVLFSIESLRQPLVIAFAELAGECVDVETIIRLKRQKGGA